jgi:hypothetical protein
MQVIGGVGKIRIAIEYSDDVHIPPSFMAQTDDHGARISIDGLDVLEGWLSAQELAAVRAWANKHLAALLDRWESSSHGRVVELIV